MTRRRGPRRARQPAVDYGAQWAPKIIAANERIARERVEVTNAFGTFEVTRLSWSEVTGVMYHVGSGMVTRTFCADLHWVDRLASGAAL